jgi:hypothetical protein
LKSDSGNLNVKIYCSFFTDIHTALTGVAEYGTKQMNCEFGIEGVDRQCSGICPVLWFTPDLFCRYRSSPDDCEQSTAAVIERERSPRSNRSVVHFLESSAVVRVETMQKGFQFTDE